MVLSTKILIPIPRDGHNSISAPRAAPMCVLRRCKDEREDRKRGAIHWRGGASLAFLGTCGLFLHPVQTINKQNSSPLILSPPTNMKHGMEKLIFLINIRLTIVWTSKFYTLELFLLRQHLMTWHD